MRRPGVAAVAVSVAAVLLLAALFAGDAVWTAFLALAGAGLWGALALLGRAPAPAAGGLLLGALLALAAWSGLSVLWSIAPDRSWEELNRTLVLAAFLAVGLLVGAVGGTRRAALALSLVLAAGIGWALAGKAIPALFEDGGRAARLREPIGYWNALALAADAALVLGLWLAASWRRGAGVALAYAAVAAVLLAASRAGVAAAVIGVAVWVWLRRDRVEAALLALTAALPAVLVSAWAFTRDALVEDGQARADRVADGAWFGLLLVVGGVLAVGLAGGALRLDRDRMGTVLRRGAVAAAALALLLLLLNTGRIADDFRGGEVANDPGRFTSLSSNNRSAWWGEAWDVFRAEPLLGAGANTFAVARKRYRETASQVTQPHSVPLQFLAGTGLVGLALLAAFLAAAAASATGAIRRLEGRERDAAVALALVPGLWVLHALVDYDWDFLAVTGPALFALGVLAAAGRELVFQKHKAGAAAVAALAAAAVVSVATPWLAERSVREVGDALGRGDADAALAAAERAASLDPLALDPLFAEARVHEVERDAEAALATYREAADLQPENPESLYQLGLYEFSRGDRCSAYTHLNEAYTLDPAGAQWTPDSELVQALAWVDAGNCG